MDNPFALLNLPEEFVIDTDGLTRTYRTLAARFHPDRYAAASAFEQREAVMMAAAVNSAYQTLLHPLDRAAALLKRRGIEADAPEHTAFPPDFLMRQMAWRETLAQARAEGDGAALRQLAGEIAAEQSSLNGRLAEAFAQESLEEAAQLVRQGRFFDKLARETADAL